MNLRSLSIMLILILTLILLNQAVAMASDVVKVEQLENQIKEIQRDQLNYQLEKDLLKETYSTNYGTIQLVLTIILGVFTVLGYLGVQNINSIKKEYDSELTKIKELKADFKNKLQDLIVSQEKVQGELQLINSRNEEQDKKIKLIEIKEKITSHIKEKNYPRAWEYVGLGLDMANNDYELLSAQALLFIKFKNYPVAIESYKNLISANSINHPNTILNLAELYLITGLIGNYDQLVAQYPAYFNTNIIYTYLESFKLYLQNNVVELKRFIQNFIDAQDETILQLGMNFTGVWEYEDLYEYLNTTVNSTSKTVLIHFTNYLKGSISGAQMKQIMETIK